jgi:hypothetical protein
MQDFWTPRHRDLLRANGVRRWFSAAVMALAVVACTPAPKQQEPAPTPELQPLTPVPLPEPVTTIAQPAAASPTAVEAPAEATEAALPPTIVRVSDLPSDSTQITNLFSYDKPKKGKLPTVLEVNTDRNAVEFPLSLTRAETRYANVPSLEGAGPGRALEVEFTMPAQTTPYAPCMGKGTCGCHAIVPYAYVSLTHTLPPGSDLSTWDQLSFWARSKELYGLHVVLGCFTEARPRSNVPPFNGYLDDELTEMDPCWQPRRVELKLADPVQIAGDDKWHRYEVSIAGLPPGQPIELSGGKLMACTLDKVTHITFVMKKSRPPLPIEYPKDHGIVWLDDVQALRRF